MAEVTGNNGEARPWLTVLTSCFKAKCGALHLEAKGGTAAQLCGTRHRRGGGGAATLRCCDLQSVLSPVPQLLHVRDGAEDVFLAGLGES